MMEGDGTSASPPSTSPNFPSRTTLLIQRLCRVGVPMNYLESLEMGLMQFVKENKGLLQEIVRVLMPSTEDVKIQGLTKVKGAWHEYKQGCREGIRWVQWLIFGGNPKEIMRSIQQETGHVRGVCGAVWGSNDIAYRCRTCENDPTCAICVPCFESDKHYNHDYSMIHTGGGCCDCGDVTAWKESGFCSRHSGTGQAPCLSEALRPNFELVMEALLSEWGNRLQVAANSLSEVLTEPSKPITERVATGSSLAIIEMLISFCNCSESLLTCSGNLIASEKIGLLDLLLKSEYFLPDKALNKLHELLLKLMGNPSFKCQFAKVFIRHYPHLIQDGLRQSLESSNGDVTKESAALNSFSVQIFTVPTLTTQLVVHLKLLDMLLDALKEAFLSCSEQQLVNKNNAVSFFCRIIDDIRFVLRHAEVADYVARERLDLLKAWIHLLAFTQGMVSQRRQTSIHVEEESESWYTAYILEVQMASVQPLLIEGAAKIDSSPPAKEVSNLGWTVDEAAMHGHAKIGRTSAGSDVSGKVGTSDTSVPMDVDAGTAEVASQGNDYPPGDDGLPTALSKAGGVPSVLLWLIAECSKVLDILFLLDEYRESSRSSRSNVQRSGLVQWSRLHLRGRGGRATSRSSDGSAVDHAEDEALENHKIGGVQECRDNQDGLIQWWMGPTRPEPGVNTEFLRSEREWLDIKFDVSQQEVSFHIPLHRFLAVALQKSLETNPNLNYKEGNKRSWHCQDHLVNEKGFLIQLFPTCYQTPAFISCLMEHPLQIQVLCAQVWAGMWRKNGDSIRRLCEHYRSVKWCEGSLDLDLFLLQCCGVMAPTEDFVGRIVSRFGLNDYFSLFFHMPNEYETTLAQHMLALLIQIVVERGFCGLTSSQACRRELIRRLAVSDATHSQLMKALPPRLHEDKQWQDALLAVATYYKPSGMHQGRFSLQQECWKEMDLYHPRWNARELQSAEDRFLRACKVSPVVKQLPQWQKPFAPFENLSRLATCKKVHDILRSTFFHAVFSKTISESCAPENVLITALHLLALGLDVCSMFGYKKGSEYKFGSFQSETGSPDAQEPPPLLANATEYVYFGGVDNPAISNKQSLVSLLVLLMRRYGSESEVQGAAGELQSCNIGALIKGLLEKFSNLHSGCMYEIESLAPAIFHRVLTPENSKSVSIKISKQHGLSEADKKKLLARERQAAVMAKMKAAQEKFVASCQSAQEQDDLEKEPLQSKFHGFRFQSQDEQTFQSPITVMCALCRDSTCNSPTSLLTFVQRSKLLEIAQKGVPSWEKRERFLGAETSVVNERADNGSSAVVSEVQESQVRLELLNRIQMAVNEEVDRGPMEVEALLAFLAYEGFTETVEGSQSSVEAIMAETTSSDSGSDDSAEEESIIMSNDLPNAFPDCPGSSPVKGEAASEYEDEKAKTRQHFSITVLLEYANILSKICKEQQQLETESSATSQRETVLALLHGRDHIFSNDNIGIHVSSCGHAVHQECLDRYLSSLLQRYQSRTLFEGLQIVDPNQREFLCPVCRRLANSVLPYIPERSVLGTVGEEQATSISDMGSAISTSSSAMVSLVPYALNLLHNAEELVWKPGFRKAVSKPLSRTLRATFDSLFWTLFGLYFPGRENNSRHSSSNYLSQSLLLWDVLRYTVLSAELSCRSQEDALRSEHTIDVLFKSADKGSILPVLLKAAKAIQNQNRQSLLLRARGIQLLVGSLCFGLSKDLLSEPFVPGSVSKLLHLIENGNEAADIHFWRRTADPILAHDPFSSLFWIIFSLPLSFPSSTEPFVSLVHLLYLVCIFQIMASMGNFVLANLSELRLTSSTCAFTQTVLTRLAALNLFQTIADQTSEILAGSLLSTLRRFTLPYLRRCALLGRLFCDLKFNDTDFESGKVYDFDTANKGIDSTNNENKLAIADSIKDLKELEILERGFLLPSLQIILEDKVNQGIVLKWCNHALKESGQRKLQPVPRPAIAAPFKLMDLPPLYQTLLQLYIKERCPVCLKVPEQPALCLLCGTLCCGLSRHPCCSTNRQSECFRHAVTCNGGVGVFLMIKKTNILLQRSARQSYWPSLYLDDFGEEDIHMLRGKPLHLSEERYAALTKIVVSHGIDQSSLVLSRTTWETVIWD